jgi:hypothetical protein
VPFNEMVKAHKTAIQKYKYFSIDEIIGCKPETVEKEQ